jgi:fumarylacetoacetate (FAA) hydrolase
MKLASWRDGSRDGRLVVVSRDLSRCADAAAVAPCLQKALDDWDQAAPRLQDVADGLEAGHLASMPFAADNVLAPLPRAYGWLDGSAYLSHVELARRARGAGLPPNIDTDPLMYRGGSDGFLAARDPIPLDHEEDGLDLEGEIAIVTGDVPPGCDAELAVASIRLVMLVNDLSLRHRIPGELAKGFGFVQSKLPAAFSPVAVTPDELGPAWDGHRLDVTLRISVNDRPLGALQTGRDMQFGFPELIRHAAHTRRLGAGTIIGSGTVSNRGPDGGPGRPVDEGGDGFACLAEARAVEALDRGSAVTDFLRDGDRVRIEAVDEEGFAVFGAIEQRVVQSAAPNRVARLTPASAARSGRSGS